MRTAGIRNTPVDRRYLSDQDKSDYNNSGGYGKAAQAVGRARAYRGRMAYQQNRPERTVTRTPGSGSMRQGRDYQQDRLRKVGQDNSSPFKLKSPSNKGDIFKGID